MIENRKKTQFLCSRQSLWQSTVALLTHIIDHMALTYTDTMSTMLLVYYLLINVNRDRYKQKSLPIPYSTEAAYTTLAHNQCHRNLTLL
jgi:hypothetical protein